MVSLSVPLPQPQTQWMKVLSENGWERELFSQRLLTGGELNFLFRNLIIKSPNVTATWGGHANKNTFILTTEK